MQRVTDQRHREFHAAGVLLRDFASDEASDNHRVVYVSGFSDEAPYWANYGQPVAMPPGFAPALSVPTLLIESIWPDEAVPFTISEVTCATVRLVLDPPLVLTAVRSDEDPSMLEAADSELTIDVHGIDLQELAENARSQLAFLWDAYASDSVDVQRLTPKAQRLRERLRARIRLA